MMKRVLAAIVPSLLLPLSAQAQDLRDLVDIQFLEPQQSNREIINRTNRPTQFQTGWPITIRMTMNNPQGIANASGFPAKGQTGYVIFEDPDGCLAMDSLEWVSPENPDATFVPSIPDGCDPAVPRPESDEIYVEFTPDVDDAGVPDTAGNSKRRNSMVDVLGGGQVIESVELFPGSSTSDVVDVTLGPDTGDDVVDGYGFGADDDVIGLVLIAEHGAGIYYNETGVGFLSKETDGTRQEPMVWNNLAGFTNTVSYELNSLRDETAITASLVVPTNLISPFIIADDCVGEPAGDPNCDGGVLWSLDGRPPRNPETVLGLEPGTIISAFDGKPLLYDRIVYTVSAFMVSGLAPNRVTDMNFDGEVTAADLRDMGYTVLSRKQTLRFNQLSKGKCFGAEGQLAYRDFDGNGISSIPAVCPPSPIGVSPIPR